MKVRNILMSIVLITLMGCSFVPKYRRPDLPTAQTYPLENCNQESTDVDQIGWKDFFDDPALQELICLALENNRDLRIAIQRIAEAFNLYGVTRADLFPNVNATSLDVKARIPSAVSQEISPTIPGFIFSFWDAALSSNWEIDFWGRLRSLTAAGWQNYLASEEAQRAVVVSLIEHVAESYLIAVELNERIDIARHTIEIRQKSFYITRRRYEVGSVSKIDPIQAETLLTQAQADLDDLLRQRDLNWNALTLLVGTPIPNNVLPLSEVEPYFTKEIAAGLPSDLLINRPDILAAEHNLKAANANIGAARAAFFPNITLTGAWGTASNQLKNLFPHGQRFWTYIPNISLPIFDAGRNLANLDVSEARRNIAVSEYELTIQNAFREVADALAERLRLAEQVVHLKAALDAQNERSRIAWLRYEYGAAPYLEVLDAERDRYEAEQALVQAQRALLTSRIDLYAALGGGAIYMKCGGAIDMK